MASEAPIGQQLADECESIVDTLTDTIYQYPPYFVDRAAGIYYIDCSGFVSLVLGWVAPRHLDAIPPEPGLPAPQAYLFYEFLSGLPTDDSGGWRQIDRLADALPGDIIAWTLGTVAPGHDTGHVFIVADVPFVLDETHMAVPAYDSSNVLHYDDSRVLPDDGQATGVGSGTINFVVGTDGKPAEFQFGPRDPYFPVPIAIGRLGPIPPAATT
jgi:hypothetical protein